MNLSYKKGINIITMKIALYFSALAVLLGACSSSQNFTRAQEDDIYYVPGKRSLFAQLKTRPEWTLPRILLLVLKLVKTQTMIKFIRRK